MANPLKKYAEYGGFETDPRWQGYGVPPTSNANYAWILHILNKLNVSCGIAGFLLAMVLWVIVIRREYANS